MSIFNRISKADLAAKYTHRGTFLLVPIYIGAVNSDAPNIAERNGIPTWCLDAALGLFAGFAFVMSFLAPAMEVDFPIMLTSRLDGQPLLNRDRSLRP